MWGYIQYFKSVIYNTVPLELKYPYIILLWNGNWMQLSTRQKWFICCLAVFFVFFSLSLSSVRVALPRAPSPSPGGAGPVWSDAWGPAGQMEATASDIFRNLQRGQCDWLCCVHKGTKGTRRHFIMFYISLCLPQWWRLWVVLCCHLLEKLYNADISSPPGTSITT